MAVNTELKTDYEQPEENVRASTREIKVTHARSNNLKEVSLTIPHGQWVSFCGLSGSGKSSLAFDTMYAEGQRRYVECLSPKTRQFVQQMAKPDADKIEGVPPSIAIRPSATSSSKETVGSATEIMHLLSELFARAAVAVCPNCSTQTLPKTKAAMTAEIFAWEAGAKVQVCYRLAIRNNAAVVLKQAIGAGFVRAIVGDDADAKTIEIANLDLAEVFGGEILVVVDRVVAGTTNEQRIYESLELAMHFGVGTAVVLAAMADSEGDLSMKIDGGDWRRTLFTRSLVCATCEHHFAKPEQRLFQRQHPAGACKSCGGSGLDKTIACDVCGGGGFANWVNEFQVASLTISKWATLTVDQAREQMDSLIDRADAVGVVQSLGDRLAFLQDTGLGYLGLNRAVATLSSGERQRVKLTSVLGSTLINMLYVLNEPAMGLHPVEVALLNTCISRLHRKGNTVLVVDHNPEVIVAAERVVEIGPGAGASGGEVVFDGTPEEMLVPQASLTGEYIGQRRGLSCRSDLRRRKRGAIRVVEAATHNLKNVSVELPLGGLCVLTGVSGSGKSSLLVDTIYPAIRQRHETAEGATTSERARLRLKGNPRARLDRRSGACRWDTNWANGSL